MPDRAVVDVCDICKGTGRVSYAPDGFAYVYPKPCPACTPRALVALSEDRQWLVVLSREIRQIGYTTPFAVLRCHGGDYMIYSHVKDTGQDAHEVLEQFLKERDHA